MKAIKIGIVAALILSTGVFAWKKMSTPWVADMDKAVITFDLPDGGASGSVKGLDAAINFNPMSINESSITASVDVKTLTTGIDMRDKHLMSNDYFDADKHPKITFTASSFIPGDNGYIATGKLSMRDTVREVSIPFIFTETGDSARFKGSFTLFAGDYGVGKKSKKGADKVVVSIDVLAYRKK
ncbi:MAG: YceI family protein [Bacteroidia bacterium]|jgi:polyisoprenoid-binding protein YceI|nr:YceI family protein [Bacteroidia bacterium]